MSSLILIAWPKKRKRKMPNLVKILDSGDRIGRLSWKTGATRPTHQDQGINQTLALAFAYYGRITQKGKGNLADLVIISLFWRQVRWPPRRAAEISVLITLRVMRPSRGA